VTVSVPPGDNWMLHVAVEQCRPGDVLVVAPTTRSDAGYFGELLATASPRVGVVGLVIDAGCRDIAELTRMRFPVWSRCVSAFGTVKETLGSVNIPLACAGQLVRPGDVVVADDDGVVIVPREEAAAVAGAAAEREQREARSRERYRNGELSLDIHGCGTGSPPRACATSITRRTARHDHRLPRPLHHRAGQPHRVPRGAAGPAGGPALPAPPATAASDDAVREAIENHQLKVLRERGGDLMLFSRRPRRWPRRRRPDDRAGLGARLQRPGHQVTRLFPGNFAAVCQLPQTPGGSLRRLRRRAAAVRRGAGLRRYQPQPGPVGWPLERPR